MSWICVKTDPEFDPGWRPLFGFVLIFSRQAFGSANPLQHLKPNESEDFPGPQLPDIRSIGLIHMSPAYPPVLNTLPPPTSIALS